LRVDFIVVVGVTGQTRVGDVVVAWATHEQ
jgi:hypothetical protein